MIEKKKIHKCNLKFNWNEKKKVVCSKRKKIKQRKGEGETNVENQKKKC